MTVSVPTKKKIIRWHRQGYSIDEIRAQIIFATREEISAIIRESEKEQQ